MTFRFAAAAALLAIAACTGAPWTQAPSAVPAAATRAGAATVLLDEEFDEPKLDAALWATCYAWVNPGQRCTNGGNLELEWYHPQNVRLSGGSLQLVAQSHPTTHAHPFTSGMIQTGGYLSTKPTFAFRYGYAEIRAKLPRGPGMWPAFWLVQANRQWPPEIDIMEWQGVQPAVDVVTVHWKNAQGQHEQSSTGANVHAALWQAYHTYGADWEPGAITWYFDGKPVKRFAQTRWIPDKPMIVILNLAIGGWEAGQHDPSLADFPATFGVDYVRVWSKRPF